MVIKVFRLNASQVYELYDTIVDASSLQYNIKLYDFNSFELHCSTNHQLQTYDLIVFEINGAKLNGMITSISKSLDDIAIVGYDLKCLMSMRKIRTTRDGSTSTKMWYEARDLIRSNLGEGATAERQIASFSHGTDSVTGAESAKPEYGIGESLSELVFSFVKSDNVVLRFDFDDEDATIEYYFTNGRNKTNELIFSRKNRNVESIQLNDDITNIATVVSYKVGDAWHDYPTDCPSGYYRRELYNDNYELEYQKQGEQQTLECSANSRMIFNADYQIGDYVTIQFDSVSYVKQITEISIAIEHSRFETEITFGTVEESALKKLVKGGI